MAEKSWMSYFFGRNSQPPNASHQSDSGSSARSPLLRSNDASLDDHHQLLHGIVNEKGSPFQSPPSNANPRELDPSGLRNGSTEKNTLFVNTDPSRKRQLTNSPDGVLASDRIKRFREIMKNDDWDRTPSHEMHPVKSRLESSFAGPFSQRNASMLDSPGGSSTISIFSKRSNAPSTQSNISSKTKAILEQLERVSTPQKEERTIFRPSSVASEIWNTSWHAGTNRSTITASDSFQNPPPLRRQPVVPSRLQMLTSTMSTRYKKPYWRDLYRPKKPASDDQPSILQSPTIQRVQAAKFAKVSPLFDLSEHVVAEPVSATKPFEAPQVTVKAPVKGADGRKLPNKFNARDLEDFEDREESGVEMFVRRRDLPKVATPPKDFVNDCLFDFSAPLVRGPQTNVSSSSSETSEESTSEEVTSDAENSDEPEPEKTTSKQTTIPANKVPIGSSVPPTDSETSASAVATPSSSQNTSPESLLKTPVSAAGDTTVKFDGTTTYSNGTRPGDPSNRAQPQGLPLPPTVSHGEKGKAWDCPDCMVPNKADASKCVCCGHVRSPAAPKQDRKDWSCPDCMVDNKAASSKCVCCGHVMYKDDSEKSESTSIFGNSTFKPTASTNLVKFGVPDAAKPTGVSFGIKPAPVPAPSTSLATSTVPSFGFPTTTTTTATQDKPKFGFGMPVKETPSVPEQPKETPIAKPAFGIFGTPTEAVKAPVTPLVSKPEASGSASIFGTAASTIKPIFGAPSTASTLNVPPSLLPSASVPSTTSTQLPPPAVSSLVSTSTSTASTLSTGSPLFGNKLGTPAAPLFGSSAAPASTNPPPSGIFGKPAAAPGILSGTPIFGSSSPATTGTQPPQPAQPPAATKPFTFGASTFGGPPSSSGVNGSSSTSTDAPEVKRPFGGTVPASFNFNTPESKAPTSTSTFAPQANGFNFGTNGFGSSSSAPSLGGLAQPAAQGSFSVAAPTAPPTSSFNFGGAPDSAPKVFQFGGSSSNAPSAAPFVFGAAAPAAASTGFSFGNAAPLAPIGQNLAPFTNPPSDSPFAFNSGPSGAPSAPGRKIASARRRIVQQRR